MDVFTTFPTYFVAELHKIDPIYAGVVALVFGLLTPRFAATFFFSIIAAVVYYGALLVVPWILHNTPIPAIVYDVKLLKTAIALYVVFLVADTVVFGIKALAQRFF